MKRSELQELVQSSIKRVVPTDINRHEETLQFFADEAGHLPSDKAALFAYMHAVEIAEQMVEQVVVDLMEELNILKD